MKLCEDVRHTMDGSEVVALIIMNLSKSFDCLPHALMVARIIAYDMSHPVVKILISCLRHGSDINDGMTFLKAIPRGSILWVCLFK